jgi:hypothetical protein
MRFNSVIEELSGTPLYLLGLFVALLLVMHLVLIRLSSLSDVAWKKVDYIWLCAAALGLIGSSGKVDQFLSERYSHGHGQWTANSYRFLRNSLINPVGVCTIYTKSPNSPPDFDEMAKENQELCLKSNEIAKQMPKSFENGDYPPLADTGFKRFGQNVKYETQFIANINRIADEYAADQAAFAQYKETSKPSDAEDVLTVLSPLLIAFALALRITKVTGDIKNARNKL